MNMFDISKSLFYSLLQPDDNAKLT